MTNKDKLNAMSSKELATFITSLARNELFCQMDLEKWMDESDEGMCYLGEKKLYKVPGEKQYEPCYLLQNYTMMGGKFALIIKGNKKLTVPASCVS